jgi:hypothetical protein
MTENAAIARLWSGYHHLSEVDKDLVVSIAETARRRGDPGRNRPGAADPRVPDRAAARRKDRPDSLV